MAAETDVIKEFLVSLGFKVDENGLKKFVGGLGMTNNAAMTAGKAVLGVAIAAEAMVVRFSSVMEKLYYQSKRTDASVENLQALEFGSRKIGLAAGVAREALENMVSAARMNPGMRGLIDGLLGKNTAGLDQAQVMLELVQKLAEMPHFQGAQYAQMFGMDEKTFLMLKQGLPELIKAEEERRNMNRQAGIDAQAAAEAGKEYANSIKDITERLGVLRDRVAIELLPSFRDFNKEVVKALDGAAWFKLDEHPNLKPIANAPAGAANALGNVATGIKELDGGKVWQGVKGMMYNAPGTALIRSAWGKLGGDRVRITKTDPDAHRTATGKIKYPGQTPPGGNVPLGIRNNNPGNLRSWGDAQRGEGGFVRFGSSAEGLSAMAGNLLAYYNKHGLNNVRDIIARWAPASDNNNTGAYIDSVAKRLGVGATDKLNLKDPSVLSRLMGAIVQHENGYVPYGSAEIMAAAQNRLGRTGDGRPVVIHQKTDIHVNGADSPAETGRSVALAQDQVNGNLVRNMQGAVQ